MWCRRFSFCKLTCNTFGTDVVHFTARWYHTHGQFIDHKDAPFNATGCTSFCGSHFLWLVTNHFVHNLWKTEKKNEMQQNWELIVANFVVSKIPQRVLVGVNLNFPIWKLCNYSETDRFCVLLIKFGKKKIFLHTPKMFSAERWNFPSEMAEKIEGENSLQRFYGVRTMTCIEIFILVNE